MAERKKPNNRLLAGLPMEEWERIRSHFTEIDLNAGDVLFEISEPFSRIYFPTAGVITTLTEFENGETVEMATTGREGMVSIGAVLGSKSSLSSQTVQVPGRALVLGYTDFKRFRQEVPAFGERLMAYAQAFVCQILQSVACNAVHPVEERAARWLLMCHDRADADTFLLTQEALAELLGVSRNAVGGIARGFQLEGLIRYSRGAVTINDRAGMESASCECYQIVRQQYEDRLTPEAPHQWTRERSPTDEFPEN